MIKGNFKKLNRFMGIVLSVLLISMPALAQSAPQQEQQENVVSDAEQKEPEKPLSDKEQGRFFGKMAGEAAMKNIFWLTAGTVTAVGLPLIGFALFKDSQSDYFVSLTCDDLMGNGGLDSIFGGRNQTGLIIGIVLGLAGGLLQPLNKPSPYVFIGKPPEYVDSYQKAFRSTCKKEQILQYYTGYACGLGLLPCIYLLIVGYNFSLGF